MMLEAWRRGTQAGAVLETEDEFVQTNCWNHSQQLAHDVSPKPFSLAKVTNALTFTRLIVSSPRRT